MAQESEQGFFGMWLQQRARGTIELVSELLQGSFPHTSGPQQRRLDTRWLSSVGTTSITHAASPAWWPHAAGLCRWWFRVPNERDQTGGIQASYNLKIPECHLQHILWVKQVTQTSPHSRRGELDFTSKGTVKHLQPYLISYTTKARGKAC